jgi:MFS transporter, DHA3 family, macrolide efflux protein
MSEEVERVTGKTGYRRLLRASTFRNFFFNQVLTNLGDGLLATGSVYAATTLDVPAWGLGLVGGALTIPKAVVGPLGGVISDRTDIKYLLVAGETLRVAAAGLLFAFFASGAGSLWLLVVLAGLASAVPGLAMPAAKSLIPKLVAADDLQAANGLAQAVVWPAFFIGSGLLAVVAVTGSSSLPFFVVGVLLSVSILALWRIPRQPRRAVGQRAVKLSVRRDVVAGYQELRGEQVLHRRMVTYGLFTLFWRGTFLVLIPLVVLQHTHSTPLVFGSLTFVNGASEFVASLIIGRVTLRRPLVFTFACEILLGVSLLGILVSLQLPIPEIALFPSVVLIGIAAASIDVPLVTIVHQRIGEDNIGKVFSFWVTMGSAGGAAGALLFGLYFDSVPLGPGTLLVAVVAVLIGVAQLTWARRATAAPIWAGASESS